VVVPGLRRYNESRHRAVPAGADPGDGSGPEPPFGPTSSGRLPDRRPLSTGWSGPSRVSPPGASPSPWATPAVGPGTRTALAHCAVPGPKPAGVAEGDSSWVSCGGRRYLGGATRRCQPPADLHRCANAQVGTGGVGADYFPLWARVSACRSGRATRGSSERAIDPRHPIRWTASRAPRRSRSRSPRRSAGRARRPPTRLPSGRRWPPQRRGTPPGPPGRAHGCECRPG
jgi:hypothetical protein